MKLLLNIIIMSLVFTKAGFGQKRAFTTISGQVNKEYVKKIFLYYVINGEMKEYASTDIDDNGQYAFALPTVREGFYYIGDNVKSNAVYTRLYLKPKAKVTVNITPMSGELKSELAENKLLAEWQNIFNEVAVQSFQFMNDVTGYVTFFPKLNKAVEEAAVFKKKIKTANKEFNLFMKFLVDNDLEFAALNMLYTPRTAHPSKEEWPDFYQTIIQPGKYCTTDVLALGDGLRRIALYAQFNSMNGSEKPKNAQDYFQFGLNALCNDTLKGYHAINYVKGFKNLEELKAMAGAYKQYFVTDSLKARYMRLESSLATYARGEKAFNFSYPDINGKRVSLSDLKGKVVLVDVWATWCGPCIKEIPSLKLLEESVKDKDIAIVSISMDEEKDFEKWKNFVKTENLGGIQLYAKGFSEFSQYYKINTIPRFLVFDKKGNIVTVDAPRPSDPKLKDLLLKVESES